MMTALLLLMIVLAAHSLFLDGAEKGIEFYLVPNWETMNKLGWGNVIYAAMSQAFFTLSIGIGAMLIFGAYLPPRSQPVRRSVHHHGPGYPFVALMAGFIIIRLLRLRHQTGCGSVLDLPDHPQPVHPHARRRFWGMLFFVFLSFAALSTVIAVFENIIAFGRNLYGWERRKVCASTGC